MKVKGTLRMASQPDVAVGVNVEALPGRLVVKSGSTTIGDWSSEEVELQTAGDKLVVIAEGESQTLDVSNRYGLLDTFRAAADSDRQVPPLAERMTGSAPASRSFHGNFCTHTLSDGQTGGRGPDFATQRGKRTTDGLWDTSDLGKKGLLT